VQGVIKAGMTPEKISAFMKALLFQLKMDVELRNQHASRPAAII
jgi:hypothetical protein